MWVSTFSGNVSIAGTLTYEDVTNVDSVGIITARSDVSIADKIIHTGDTNTAIRFPAADTFTVETAGSERVRIGQYGTLGVGCIPNDFQNNFDAVQIGGNLVLNVDSTGAGAGVYMSNNVYRDRTDSRWEYINTDEATQYIQANGEHIWRYAASGTSDTAITWSEALRITSVGEVRVGSAFSVGQAGIVTAAEYHGDGSNLTNLPAAGLSTAAATVAGIVTTLDLSSAQDHKITVSGISTVTVKGGTEGDSHTVRIINSGITTVGFSTFFLFPSGADPSMPTASGAISLISFTVNRVGAGGTQLLAGAALNYS